MRLLCVGVCACLRGVRPLALQPFVLALLICVKKAQRCQGQIGTNFSMSGAGYLFWPLLMSLLISMMATLARAAAALHYQPTKPSMRDSMPAQWHAAGRHATEENREGKRCCRCLTEGKAAAASRFLEPQPGEQHGVLPTPFPRECLVPTLRGCLPGNTTDAHHSPYQTWVLQNEAWQRC